MRYVSDKRFRENQNTHCMFNNVFLRKPCRLWDNAENILELERPQTTVCRMCISCWIPIAINTPRICIYNTRNFFSTATMVAQTILNIMLYVHFLSCCIIVNASIIARTHTYRHIATADCMFIANDLVEKLPTLMGYKYSSTLSQQNIF
jgi:hypothetical protein